MKKVLFIGNSFVYYNDLPALFKDICTRAGYEIETDSVTKGGWYLRRYADEKDEMGPAVREAIARQGWDYIVLQDQSFNPAADPADLLTAVDALRALMPDDQQVLMYQTWAYRDNTDKQRSVGLSYEMLYFGLKASYEAAAKRIGGLNVPVGDAFRLCKQEHPEIDLYFKDDYHPGLAGSYLAACVFFKEVFGASPCILPSVEGLDENTAAKLRGIAEMVYG